MKREMKQFVRQLVAIGMVFAMALVAAASNTNLVTVPLSMSVSESYTVNCTGGPVNFTYSGTTGTTSNTLSCTTMWSLDGSETTVETIAWLSGTTGAVLTGPSNIPAADVFSNVTLSGGATFQGSGATGTNPCTQNADLGGAGLACSAWGYNHPGTLPMNSSYTATILMSLAGLPANLQAGTYSGTLNIQGEVQ